MTYKRRCKFCGKEIWIDQINNKWTAYEDEYGTIGHKCDYPNNQNIIVKKLQKIESDISTIYRILDSHSMQLEKINEMSVQNE